MALKALVTKKNLDQARAELEQLEEREADFMTRKEAMEIRVSEVEAAIEEMTEESSDEDRSVVEETAVEVDKEREDLEAEEETIRLEKTALEDKIAELEEQLRSDAVAERKEDKTIYAEVKPMENTMEERAQRFYETGRMGISAEETRATLITTGSLAKPAGVGGINDPFNTVSSIIDMIQVEDMTGMGEYSEAYIKAWQAADAAADGTASTPSDPAFRVAKIKPFLMDVLSYISENVALQTPLQYEAKIKQGALIALRKKAAEWIIGGNGSTAPFGIYNAVNSEVSPERITQKYEVKSATIGEKTLRNIVFEYGGDENVGGGARLFLNKKDLIAFGDVRGTSEKKAVYEIIPDGANPNTGVIKDAGLVVPYVISSDLTALTGSVYAAANIPTMIYGNPANYKLGLFGNFDVRVSEDYKFAEGLLTIRGKAMVGGNVIVDKGFVVVELTNA